MGIRKIQPSGLFLVEILISILFFSLFSAVCVQFFVHSSKMIQTAEETEKAAEKCASLAELMESADTAEEFFSLLKNSFGIHPEYGKDMKLGFNENYELTDSERATHILLFHLTEEGDILQLNMKFVRTKDEIPVYSLIAEHHYPLEVSDEQGQ